MREVFLVDGTRTPFLKARGKPGPFLASDLATYAGRQLLLRNNVDSDAFDEVILGCVSPTANEVNIGRMVALRLGISEATPAWTVQRNCASGMQALDSAFVNIASGRHDLVLAGGAEAMSHAPLLFNERMVNWLANWFKAKTVSQRGRALLALRPNYFAPVLAILKGLTDPNVGISMGQTAEIIGHQFNITREQMDRFAVESHKRLAYAIDQKQFQQELVEIFDQKGSIYDEDDGLRRDSDIDKLAKLKPFFDKKFGLVTAGNSSQVTDGAALLILASKDAVKKYQLPVLARIADIHWAGLSPETMGLGPVYASTQLLQKNGLQRDDINFWELNEAFAAQVLACLNAWQDNDFCQRELKLERAFGEIDPSIVNIDGGACALGHPVGATGARIALHLSHILRRKQAKYGVATLCIGGGQGGAVLLENPEVV